MADRMGYDGAREMFADLVFEEFDRGEKGQRLQAGMILAAKRLGVEVPQRKVLEQIVCGADLSTVLPVGSKGIQNSNVVKGLAQQHLLAVVPRMRGLMDLEADTELRTAMDAPRSAYRWLLGDESPLYVDVDRRSLTDEGRERTSIVPPDAMAWSVALMPAHSFVSSKFFSYPMDWRDAAYVLALLYDQGFRFRDGNNSWHTAKDLKVQTRPENGPYNAMAQLIRGGVRGGKGVRVSFHVKNPNASFTKWNFLERLEAVPA